ncbi:MAG: M15 family metallopeptidase [Bacilli bacterium]
MKKKIIFIIILFHILFLIYPLRISFTNKGQLVFNYDKDSKLTLEESIYILVNKKISLKRNYKPNDLTLIDKKCRGKEQYLKKQAAVNFNNLCFDMLNLNMNLKATSAFRTYTKQESLFNQYVKEEGYETAIMGSAFPGHSEHQTGLAVDITFNDYKHTQIDTTSTYIWFKHNIHKYGFIIRYPEGKENITGYMYEPWHLRYVGINVATYIYENDITYDEYYEKFIKVS